MTNAPSDGAYEIDCHAVASDLREAMNSEHIPNGQVLLPCPFCGAAAELVVEHDHSWIRHNECGVHFEGGFVYSEDAVAAWNTRRSSAGVEGLDEEDLDSDERWNAGVNYAIERLCEIMGVDPKSINWDAATETVNGDVMSVICNVLVAAYGEEWSSNERDTAIIRAALTPSPTLEPTDAEVERAILDAITLLDVAINGTVFTKPSAGRVVVNVAQAGKVLEGLRSAYNLIASQQSTSGERE